MSNRRLALYALVAANVAVMLAMLVVLKGGV
jgi:hypothetical protein